MEPQNTKMKHKKLLISVAVISAVCFFVCNSRLCQLEVSYFAENERGPQWRAERAYTFLDTTLYR